MNTDVSIVNQRIARINIFITNLTASGNKTSIQKSTKILADHKEG